MTQKFNELKLKPEMSWNRWHRPPGTNNLTK